MINYIDKYTTQIFVLQMGMLVILSAIILWVYYYNRKKYHNLKHQIPASVVKNYLFRGGGLDVDPSSIPSVMPLDQLQTSTPIGVSTSGGDEALRAEVARLQSQLTEKQNIITDLENKSTDLEGTVKAKQERIEELEKLLAEAQANEGTAGGGDDEALKAQLAEVTTERDSLKEDLAQYDIIEDDLADLKRLKQENEQLRAALEGSGGSVPEAAPVAEAAPVPAAEPVVAEPEPVAVAEAAPEAVAEPAAAAPVEEVAVAPAAEDDKSPEDLLSEFEKMLG
jgi:hypothetical protein